jgi:MbtH protein
MSEDGSDDTRDYIVLINDEEQYSIWPRTKDIPRGWRAVGKGGRKLNVSNMWMRCGRTCGR